LLDLKATNTNDALQIADSSILAEVASLSHESSKEIRRTSHD